MMVDMASSSFMTRRYNLYRRSVRNGSTEMMLETEFTKGALHPWHLAPAEQRYALDLLTEHEGHNTRCPSMSVNDVSTSDACTPTKKYVWVGDTIYYPRETKSRNERELEKENKRLCVCERERERERVSEIDRERERKKERERERERGEREKERERERDKERKRERERETQRERETERKRERGRREGGMPLLPRSRWSLCNGFRQ